LVQMEQTASDVLVSWSARARVPRVLGPRRRLREAMDAWALLEAGHAEPSGDGPSSARGPSETGAGHTTGPAVPGTGWSTARRRLRDMVHRARVYARALRTEPGLTQEKLAAREGVSGARVNQVLSVLRLEESILAEMTDDTIDAPVPSLDDLFVVGKLRDGRHQVVRYRALCDALAGERPDVQARKTQQRGLQHLFVQARTLREAMDSGTWRSMSALARAEGLSSRRVGQVLDLLTLAPEIIAVVDVPPEQLPDGLTQKEVFKLAELVDADRQREAFFGRWPRRDPWGA
jgi:hypothetical protein